MDARCRIASVEITRVAVKSPIVSDAPPAVGLTDDVRATRLRHDITKSSCCYHACKCAAYRVPLAVLHRHLLTLSLTLTVNTAKLLLCC